MLLAVGVILRQQGQQIGCHGNVALLFVLKSAKCSSFTDFNQNFSPEQRLQSFLILCLIDCDSRDFEI